MLHTTGAGIHLSYGDVTPMNGASALTWCWWWKISGFTSDGHGIMGKGVSNPYRLIRHDASGAAHHSTEICIHASAIDSSTGQAFGDNQVIHAAITLTSGNAPKYYKNAVLQTSTGNAVTINAGGVSNYLVGQELQNNTDGPNDFACLKIWTAELTAAELAQEMNSFRPVRMTNLILWAPLTNKDDQADYGPSRWAVTPTGSPTTTQTILPQYD